MPWHPTARFSYSLISFGISFSRLPLILTMVIWRCNISPCIYGCSIDLTPNWGNLTFPTGRQQSYVQKKNVRRRKRETGEGRGSCCKSGINGTSLNQQHPGSSSVATKSVREIRHKRCDCNWYPLSLRTAKVEVQINLQYYEAMLHTLPSDVVLKY